MPKAIQPMYSWYGSPIHLPLSEETAAAYNRRVAQWFDAQKRHLETHGTPWNPDYPLLMAVDPEAQDAYDKVGQIVNLLVELCGGSIAIHEEDMAYEAGFLRIN